MTLGLLQAGVGVPLLLVHGGFGQIERWDPVWDGLAAHYRVASDGSPGARVEWRRRNIRR